MRKNIKFVAKALLFCFVFVMIFLPVQELFVRKSLHAPWDMTNKTSGFYNEPEDEFSVLFLGSSHAYAAFSPLEIWARTGVKSYVFATQAQPMWATLAYLKEALKTQSPELVVLECFRLVADEPYTNEGVTHSYMDDIPLSANKVALAAQSAADKEGQIPLVVNFIKYHNRWSELDEEDTSFRRDKVRDPFKGFVMLPPATNRDKITVNPLHRASKPAALSDKNEQALREIIELCQSKGIDLWMVKSPSNISPADDAKMLRAAEIAKEYDVPFTNFNTRQVYREAGIDPAKNFFDQTHMDITAATRFNRLFAVVLAERYPNLTRDYSDASWTEDFKAYRAERAKVAPDFVK